MALMFSNLIFDVSLMFFFPLSFFFIVIYVSSFINFFKILCFTIMTILYVMFFNRDMSNYIILLKLFFICVILRIFFLKFYK
jgi:hypothetical protein